MNPSHMTYLAAQRLPELGEHALHRQQAAEERTLARRRLVGRVLRGRHHERVVQVKLFGDLLAHRR
jgi:hypothetical protein